ncbi:MAG: DUF4440 domain-containing protein [Gemmatimonadales bacterium]|nr:DUF4440 domain-containing protein [Gemmatimonadales bacterium]
MPRPVVRSLLVVALFAVPAPLAAQAIDPAVRAEVLGTIHRFTDALRRKDTAGMAAQMHPAARMTLLRPAPSGDSVRVAVLTAAQFITVATDPRNPPLDEPIRDAQVTVHQDLATVWAEYQVRIDGKVSHCGYDAFHLVRTGAGWKLLTVADTFRREGCGAMW